jgi:hypothetical protein
MIHKEPDKGALGTISPHRNATIQPLKDWESVSVGRYRLGPSRRKRKVANGGKTDIERRNTRQRLTAPSTLK